MNYNPRLAQAAFRIGLVTFLIAMVSSLFVVRPIWAGNDYPVWVKVDVCQVFTKPSDKSSAVGIMERGAYAQVEDAGESWLRIVFAAAKDPKTKKLFGCKGRYIRRSDVSTVPLGRL